MNTRVNDKLVEPAGEEMVQYYFDGKEWQKKWEKRFDASEMVMDKHSNELESIRQQILAGKLSPLAYYIQTNLFNIKMLSGYTDISKRHIKKHLKPENFNKLNDETLAKYAEVFDISVEELKNYQP
jgi:hypothetical protein